MPVSVLARDENSLLGLGSKCCRLNSVVVQGIPSRCGDPTVMWYIFYHFGSSCSLT